MPSDARYSRNEAFFGQEGQALIAASRVAVVGVGGLGSHVVQQLAYLGVSSQVLVDPDIVTESSLNRMVGAVPDDATSGRYKVEVVERLVVSILPEANVSPICAELESPRAVEAITTCSSVFGCLDDDSARLHLITLCGRHQIPYFDLATDTGGEGDTRWYGGRVLFSGIGERCPACMDLLDQVALRRNSMSREDRDVERRIYGVRTDDLGNSGPAVVSLNGVVASLAATEWMAWITGLRSPKAMLEYRGHMGSVFVSGDEPSPDCYYCGLWHGLGVGEQLSV